METTFIESESINNDFTSIITIKASDSINVTNEKIFDDSTNIFNEYSVSTSDSFTDTTSDSFTYILSQTEYQSQTIKNISQSNIIISQSEFLFTTNFLITVNNEEIYQGILKNILQNYDTSTNKEMVFQGEDNFYFHITNSQNELELLEGKNNTHNKRFSIIDLGQCENLLKNHYKINQNISLIIIKFEKVTIVIFC